MRNALSSYAKAMSSTQLQNFEMKKFDSKRITWMRNTRCAEGSFGIVFPAFEKIHGVVAIKCFKTFGGPNKDDKMNKKMKAELERLKMASHENVVRVHGWTSWPGAVAIVMEYLPAGNLMDVLEDEEVTLALVLQLRFCADISRGLAYIHNASAKEKLVHGDIKAENILLTKYLECKIGDFGSSKIRALTGSLTITGYETEANKYTYLYAAPELMLNPLLSLRSKHDVFSYSILVYVILNRKLPISCAIRLPHYLTGIKSGDVRPSVEQVDLIRKELEKNGRSFDLKIMDTLKSVMISCWQHDPEERPNMVDVKTKLEKLLDLFSQEKVLEQAIVTLRNIEVSSPKRDASKEIPLDQFRFSSSTAASSAGSVQSASSLFSRSSSVATEVGTAGLVGPNIRRSVSTSTITPLNTSGSLTETVIKRPVSNFSGTVEACSLNNSPTIQRRPTSPNVYADILNGIRAIKAYRKGNKKEETIEACKELMTKDTFHHSITSRDDKLTSDLCNEAISIHKKFKESVVSAEMVGFALKLCTHIEDLEIKFSKVYMCCYHVSYISNSMNKEAMKSDIKKHCLPLLKQAYEEIEALLFDDSQEKSRQKIWCLLLLGRGYCFSGAFEEAKEMGRLCVSKMNDTYKEEAKHYRIFALSYELQADAQRGVEGQPGNESEDLYKKALRWMKFANDANDDYKTKWTNLIKEAIPKPATAERIWTYV